MAVETVLSLCLICIPSLLPAIVTLAHQQSASSSIAVVIDSAVAVTVLIVCACIIFFFRVPFVYCMGPALVSGFPTSLLSFSWPPGPLTIRA